MEVVDDELVEEEEIIKKPVKLVPTVILLAIHEDPVAMSLLKNILKLEVNLTIQTYIYIYTYIYICIYMHIFMRTLSL
jgi:hypothetical protein